MSNTAQIIVAGIVLVVFAWMWKVGHIARLRNYVLETREELRKCTWPSSAELKGSTAVVIISISLLGVFTVVADVVLVTFVRDFLLKL